MKTTGNTVLITAGGSGIGLAIAKKFADEGNRVIITGRNETKLKQAAAGLTNVTAIACDTLDVYPLYLTSPDMAIRKFNGMPY